MSSVRAIFLKFRGNNEKGWLWFRFCSCGVLFVLFCEWFYAFGVVDSLVLGFLFLFERLKMFY